MFSVQSSARLTYGIISRVVSTGTTDQEATDHIMQRGERRDDKHDKQRGGRTSAQSGRGTGGRSSSNSQQSKFRL